MDSKYIQITGDRLLKIDYHFYTETDTPLLYELAEKHGEDYKIECKGAVLNSYLYHSTKTPLIQDAAGQNIFLNHWDLRQIANAVQEIEGLRRELPVGDLFD